MKGHESRPGASSTPKEGRRLIGGLDGDVVYSAYSIRGLEDYLLGRAAGPIIGLDPEVRVGVIIASQGCRREVLQTIGTRWHDTCPMSVKEGATAKSDCRAPVKESKDGESSNLCA